MNKFSTSFLTAELVDDGTEVKIVDEGEEVPAEESKFDRDSVRITVETENGLQYKWTLNKTTVKNLISEYGSESEEWVGKSVVLNKVKQNVAGKLMDILVGEPKTTAEI